MSRFAWKGNIIHTNEKRELEIFENSWVLCENGICKGVFKELPEDWKDAELTDFGDKIIIPGFSDLHVHAAQYSYRGTGMDEELLGWLEKYAFPEEAAFSDLEYAEKAYSCLNFCISNTIKVQRNLNICLFCFSFYLCDSLFHIYSPTFQNVL